MASYCVNVEGSFDGSIEIEAGSAEEAQKTVMEMAAEDLAAHDCDIQFSWTADAEEG